MRITIAAPAKVNLRLRVGSREPSGFHAVDTLLASLRLADTVTLRRGAGKPTLETTVARPLTSMPELGPEAENLAVRAATAFMERAGIVDGPEIRLVKRIPVGAGLGGGSSDAAAVLRGMDQLHPGTLPNTDLMELAATLGSDVPFFVAGRALAHGTGRGERITALTPLPQRFVVVAVPGFPVATGTAYRWLDEDRGLDASPAETPRDTDVSWESVARDAVNDFEGPVFRRHPELRALRDRLLEAGARPALLAGSGSTVFGVFEERRAARRAVGALRELEPGVRALVTRTRTR